MATVVQKSIEQWPDKRFSGREPALPQPVDNPTMFTNAKSIYKKDGSTAQMGNRSGQPSAW
ncbi:hypothetical protein GCM10023075_07740 [Streptosporangium album]